MTSGKKLDRETVDYLRTLPEIVRRVQGGRIYYTNSFRTQATARYAMGDRPVDIFRDNGKGPEVIGYKRIERCLARWRESQDEILNSGNAKAGVENKLGGGLQIRSFSAREPRAHQTFRRVREQRELGATRRNRHFRLVPAANPISTYRPNVAPSSSPSPAKSRTMTYATC